MGRVLNFFIVSYLLIPCGVSGECARQPVPKPQGDPEPTAAWQVDLVFNRRRHIRPKMNQAFKF